MINEEYYKKRFLIFESKGGRFCPTWNWAAFIFGGFWQLFRGLVVKFFLYGLFFLSLEYLAWSFFSNSVSFFYPLLYVSFLIFNGIVANYDFYLKKVKGENLWPIFSFKNLQVKTFICVMIILYALFFAKIFLGNFWKGTSESLAVIKKIDQRIEDQVKAKCDINFEVHISAIQNLYDLEINLKLDRNQIFNYRDYKTIYEIVKKELGIHGRLERMKIIVGYD